MNAGVYAINAVDNMGIEMENHGAPGTGGVVDIGHYQENRFDILLNLGCENVNEI